MSQIKNKHYKLAVCTDFSSSQGHPIVNAFDKGNSPKLMGSDALNHTWPDFSTNTI